MIRRFSALARWVATARVSAASSTASARVTLLTLAGLAAAWTGAALADFLDFRVFFAGLAALAAGFVSAWNSSIEIPRNLAYFGAVVAFGTLLPLRAVVTDWLLAPMALAMAVMESLPSFCLDLRAEERAVVGMMG